AAGLKCRNRWCGLILPMGNHGEDLPSNGNLGRSWTSCGVSLCRSRKHERRLADRALAPRGISPLMKTGFARTGCSVRAMMRLAPFAARTCPQDGDLEALDRLDHR